MRNEVFEYTQKLGRIKNAKTISPGILTDHSRGNLSGKKYWTTGLEWAKLLLEKRTIFGVNNIAYIENENGGFAVD